MFLRLRILDSGSSCISTGWAAFVEAEGLILRLYFFANAPPVTGILLLLFAIFGGENRSIPKIPVGALEFSGAFLEKAQLEQATGLAMSVWVGKTLKPD